MDRNYFPKQLDLDFNEHKRTAHGQHIVLAKPSDIKRALEQT